MKISKTRLRKIIKEEITKVNKSKIKDVVLKVLSDEGGAAGLDPLKKALENLEKDDLRLPDEPMEEMILSVPGVKKHRDGDYIETSGLRESRLKITKRQLKKIIREERHKIIREAYVTDRKMDSLTMANRAGISPDTLHSIANEILDYFEYSEDMIDPEDYDAMIRNLVYPLILRAQKRR